jgi:hypothetical protein
VGSIPTPGTNQILSMRSFDEARAFFLHLIAAMLSTMAGVVVALALGVDGDVVLFVPVVIVAAVAGAVVRRRLPSPGINWLWLPAAVWFAGWAVASVPEGADHFKRVFIGTGYCGDFACAGQWFVTSPLIGSLSYVMAARARW